MRWCVLGLAIAALVPTLGLAGVARADREHTVARGQTLARIAARYGIPIASLAAANQLSRSTPLRPGQVLIVPPRGVVYVSAGDTLAGIARRHGVSMAELARQNRLREDALLREGQRLLLPGYEAAEAARAAERRWGTPKRRGTVTIHRLATSVTRRVRFLDHRGRVRPGALRELRLLLRPRNGRGSKPPHPRLVRLLAQISDHFGGRPIHVISGYRKAGGFTRSTSRHVAGQAIDFRIPGVPLEELRAYCARFDHVGVGYYPRSNFVHLDVRRTNARWTDLSGPGERPQIVRGGLAAVPATATAEQAAEEAAMADEPEADDDGQPPVAGPEDVPADGD